MTSQLVIENVRLGFATNSSSTHSIVILRPEDGSVKDCLPDLIENQEFDSAEFICASKESKLAYFNQILRSNLNVIFSDDSIVRRVVEDFTKFRCLEKGYIDPESVITLPKKKQRHSNLTINKEFIEDFTAFLLREDVAIVGGRSGITKTVHIGIPYKGLRELRDNRNDFFSRKDGEYWVLMNVNSGAKIRLSFNEKAAPYTKSTFPELVDLKITDYCPVGCKYCYQGSTIHGEHADTKVLDSICEVLGDMGVFEVAIGGGEPTLHPKFKHLLETCRYCGIVPNFTTRVKSWLKNKDITDTVETCGGRFAFSVDSVLDMYNIFNQAVDVGLVVPSEGYGEDDTKLSFQYVMGSTSFDQFQLILDAAETLSTPITLLGYKRVGRGKEFDPYPYEGWFKEIRSRFQDIGIDTALVEELQELSKTLPLDLGRYEKLMTPGEGKFSMYIDAVAEVMGPSSYCHSDQYVDFSDCMDDTFTCREKLYAKIQQEYAKW